MKIDARGLRCPWPAIRLARALREGATEVEILADDPAAPAELAAVAAHAGASLASMERDGARWFVIALRQTDGIGADLD
ncbi:MAG: sulfurtransferase TusA family protein [Sphingomonas sp.]